MKAAVNAPSTGSQPLGRTRHMLKVFCAPSRYTQGPDAMGQLGPEIRGLGLEGPALIVAGRSAIRLLSDIWANSFAEAER